MATQQEKAQYVKARLAYIRGECHNAVHPTVIRDRLTELIDVLEWAFFGQVSNEQPHVVPGVPVGQLEDPSRTRVTFVMNAGSMGQRMPLPSEPPPGSGPPPSLVQGGQPIRSGDVQLMPGPVGGAGAVGGQTVEFYNGPAGSGQSNAAGQRVEFFDQHLAPAAPPPVSGPSTGGQAGTPGIPTSPPGYHPQMPIPSFSNQPQQILYHSQPTLTTEAGGPVAPVPMIIPSYPSLNASPPIMPMEIPGNAPPNATPPAATAEIPTPLPAEVGLPLRGAPFPSPVMPPAGLPPAGLPPAGLPATAKSTDHGPSFDPNFDGQSFAPNFLIPGI
jgi:hypothetical protein